MGKAWGGGGEGGTVWGEDEQTEVGVGTGPLWAMNSDQVFCSLPAK